MTVTYILKASEIKRIDDAIGLTHEDAIRNAHAHAETGKVEEYRLPEGALRVLRRSDCEQYGCGGVAVKTTRIFGMWMRVCDACVKHSACVSAVISGLVALRSQGAPGHIKAHLPRSTQEPTSFGASLAAAD